MNFTVEATMSPVQDGDWDPLYHVLDVVPGTLLLENPEHPVLIIPVDAEEPMKAGLFVDGLAKLLDLTIVSGQIYPAPDDEFDFEDEDDAEMAEPNTEVVRALDCYVAEAPDFAGRMTPDGHLVVNC